MPGAERTIYLNPVGRIPECRFSSCRHRTWEQQRAAASGPGAVESVERMIEVEVPVRDAAGRRHEKGFVRKIDARQWLDEATSALVTQTWTAPERGRVTVAV